MKQYFFGFIKQSSFLTKDILQYQIGEIINIPYNSSEGINLTNGCLEFIVIEIDEENKYLKLMAKDIIATLEYDAAEPNNYIIDSGRT